MISVSIFINGNPIITRSARRINDHVIPGTASKYQVDDGRIVLHDYDEGAIELAKKLLDGVKET